MRRPPAAAPKRARTEHAGTTPALSPDELEARAAVLQARHNLRYDLRPMVQGRLVLSRPTGKILTDDFAPVETMRAIEQNNEKWKEQTEAPR